MTHLCEQAPPPHAKGRRSSELVAEAERLGEKVLRTRKRSTSESVAHDLCLALQCLEASTKGRGPGPKCRRETTTSASDDQQSPGGGGRGSAIRRLENLLASPASPSLLSALRGPDQPGSVAGHLVPPDRRTPLSATWSRCTGGGRCPPFAILPHREPGRGTISEVDKKDMGVGRGQVDAGQNRKRGGLSATPVLDEDARRRGGGTRRGRRVLLGQCCASCRHLPDRLGDVLTTESAVAAQGHNARDPPIVGPSVDRLR